MKKFFKQCAVMAGGSSVFALLVVAICLADSGPAPANKPTMAPTLATHPGHPSELKLRRIKRSDAPVGVVIFEQVDLDRT